MQIPLEYLQNLLKTLEQGGASEFEYEDEKIRFRVALSVGSSSLPGAPNPGHLGARVEPKVPLAIGSEQVVDPSMVYVTSPFVGTFYRAPAPGADNFVEVGSVVKNGQTLCIIEAMKLMNEIEAECAGTILEILSENGKSVEYGQKLFKLKKS